MIIDFLPFVASQSNHSKYFFQQPSVLAQAHPFREKPFAITPLPRYYMKLCLNPLINKKG